MGSIRKSFAKGTVWMTAARLTANGFGFLSTLVLARLLVPADFGLVALALAILAIIASVTDISVSSALIHHENPTEVHLNTVWTLQVLRGLLLLVILCAGAAPAAAIFHEPRLMPVMAALSLILLFQGLGNPRFILLTKGLVFWQQFVVQVGSKLVGLIVSAALAFAYRSYWALVGGSLSAELTTLVLSYVFFPFRPRFGIARARELFGFSIWLTLGRILSTLNWKLDSLLIGGFLSRTELGYYTVGDNLAAMPTREATAPITTTLFPALVHVRDDPARLAAAYQKAQGLLTALALPLGVGAALVADPVVRLVIGTKWLPAVPVIEVLASVFALQTMGKLSEPLAMATGNTKLLFKRDIQNIAISWPIILAGLFVGGFTGIVYARALTGSILVILHMLVVEKITGLSLRDQIAPNLRSIASCVVMAAVVIGIGALCSNWSDAPAPLIAKIVLYASAGAAAYVMSHVGLWLASGCPDGPERELLRARHTLKKGVSDAFKV